MKTEDLTIADSDSDLHRARRVHEHLSARCERAYELVQDLQALRVQILKSWAIKAVAQAIYFNEGCSAFESHDSFEDFAAEIAEEMVFACEASPDGRYFVFAPFFPERCEYLQELGLGILSGCKSESLNSLKVSDRAPRSAVPADRLQVQGLLSGEMDMLLEAYRARNISRINALRHLSTALHYVRSGLSDSLLPVVKHVSVAVREQAQRLAADLGQVIALPFNPPPAKHFGTEADRINRLTVLTPDMESQLLRTEDLKLERV